MTSNTLHSLALTICLSLSFLIMSACGGSEPEDKKILVRQIGITAEIMPRFYEPADATAALDSLKKRGIVVFRSVCGSAGDADLFFVYAEINASQLELAKQALFEETSKDIFELARIGQNGRSCIGVSVD